MMWSAGRDADCPLAASSEAATVQTLDLCGYAIIGLQSTQLAFG